MLGSSSGKLAASHGDDCRRGSGGGARRRNAESKDDLSSNHEVCAICRSLDDSELSRAFKETGYANGSKHLIWVLCPRAKIALCIYVLEKLKRAVDAQPDVEPRKVIVDLKGAALDWHVYFKGEAFQDMDIKARPATYDAMIEYYKIRGRACGLQV
jgi:hypothetical protein